MKRNGDGYLDRTPYSAYQSIKKQREKKVNDLVYVLQRVANLAGFEIESITVKDKKTDETYKR